MDFLLETVNNGKAPPKALRCRDVDPQVSARHWRRDMELRAGGTAVHGRPLSSTPTPDAGECDMIIKRFRSAARTLLMVACLAGTMAAAGCSPSAETQGEPAAAPRVSQQALDSIRAYRDGPVKKSRHVQDLGDDRIRAIDGALRQ
jgi:hypothetical protein